MNLHFTSILHHRILLCRLRLLKIILLWQVRRVALAAVALFKIKSALTFISFKLLLLETVAWNVKRHILQCSHPSSPPRPQGDDGSSAVENLGHASFRVKASRGSPVNALYSKPLSTSTASYFEITCKDAPEDLAAFG